MRTDAAGFDEVRRLLEARKMKEDTFGEDIFYCRGEAGSRSKKSKGLFLARWFWSWTDMLHIFKL
ncbi:hypothetical protein KSP39_PZI011464 [Platanthera zijinensis]|uniref:Uncharacterized protein n=1 Tax=Platanthera zijinensis TaxID=2320716 RepID=A0AAP0BGD7_9ASPA